MEKQDRQAERHPWVAFGLTVNSQALSKLISLHLWCGQIKRYGIVLEMAFVRAVAKWLLLRESAAADAEALTATQSVWLALGVN